VADAPGGDATRYVVRVRDASGFAPGIVTWTAYLTVVGDVDGPNGDIAVATTRLIVNDGVMGDLRGLYHRDR
jgi:hypothetical protein